MRTLTLIITALAFAAQPQAQSLNLEQVSGGGAEAMFMGGQPLTHQEVMDEIVDRFDLTAEELGLLNEFSITGQGNLGIIRQEEMSNTVLIDQTGTGNLSLVIQAGSDNYNSVEQIGSGNVAGIRVDGSGNVMGSTSQPGLRQSGDQNVYLLEFEGDGHTIPSSTQEGTGNQAIQLGPVTNPFGIEQYGEGNTLIIIHN